MLIVFLVVLAGCQKAPSDNKDKLVVAMELAYPPFETKGEKGEAMGVSVDIAKAFGEYVGKDVEIVNTAWDGLIASLETGKADFVISSMTITDERKEIPIKVQLFNFVLVTSIVIGVFYYSLLKIGISLDLSFVDTFKVRLVDGFVLTLQISIASLMLSLLIGIGAALLQSSKILALRYFSSGYVKLIRGTPLIVQIYLFYYVIGTAWGIDDRFIAGVLILSIFEGAYIAEIIRGSYLSLDKTQLESSKAVGFTPRQTFRFVIFPQMVARTLPALTGQSLQNQSICC